MARRRPGVERYASATNCAEYFALHPGQHGDKAKFGSVSAAADFKNDVRQRIIVFDDPRLRELQVSYSMSRGELAQLFADFPDEHARALARARNS